MLDRNRITNVRYSSRLKMFGESPKSISQVKIISKLSETTDIAQNNVEILNASGDRRKITIELSGGVF